MFLKSMILMLAVLTTSLTFAEDVCKGDPNCSMLTNQGAGTTDLAGDCKICKAATWSGDRFDNTNPASVKNAGANPTGSNSEEGEQ